MLAPWLKRTFWILGYLAALAAFGVVFFILLLFYSLGRHSNLIIEIGLVAGCLAAIVGLFALCFRYQKAGRVAYIISTIIGLMLISNGLLIGHQVKKRFAAQAFQQNQNLLADAIEVLPCTDNSTVVLAPIYPSIPEYKDELALYLLPKNKKKSYHIIDSTLTLPKVPLPQQTLPTCSNARYPTLQHALDDLASRKGKTHHD